MITEEEVKRLLNDPGFTLGRDYKVYYCRHYKRNFFTLGYFGGGAINTHLAYEVSKMYSQVTDYPIDSIYIDEIKESCFIKKFKVIWSKSPDQMPLPNAFEIDSFWSFVR